VIPVKEINAYEVLRRPLITEKSTALQTIGKYAFEVASRSTKQQIKEAVEKAFKVNVTGVSIINIKGKTKRVKTGYSMAPSWKKAIVSLKSGEKIELFEGV
jgi:large subunit ribosomal protein L23